MDSLETMDVWILQNPKLCIMSYVLHTQPKANCFYHLHVAVDNLHVAVDNDVFAKLPRCCSVDHPCRYGHVCSSACRSASKAHSKYSLQFLWKIISLTVGHMSDIERVQNSKELVVTRKQRTKWSYWQPVVVPWQRPCFLEVFHKATEVRTS